MLVRLLGLDSSHQHPRASDGAPTARSLAAAREPHSPLIDRKTARDYLGVLGEHLAGRVLRRRPAIAVLAETAREELRRLTHGPERVVVISRRPASKTSSSV